MGCWDEWAKGKKTGRHKATVFGGKGFIQREMRYVTVSTDLQKEGRDFITKGHRFSEILEIFHNILHKACSLQTEALISPLI